MNLNLNKVLFMILLCILIGSSIVLFGLFMIMQERVISSTILYIIFLEGIFLVHKVHQHPLFITK